MVWTTTVAVFTCAQHTCNACTLTNYNQCAQCHVRQKHTHTHEHEVLGRKCVRVFFLFDHGFRNVYKMCVCQLSTRSEKPHHIFTHTHTHKNTAVNGVAELDRNIYRKKRWQKARRFCYKPAHSRSRSWPCVTCGSCDVFKTRLV